MAAKGKTQKKLTYRGKPLVRSGNTLYLGDMAEEYVAMLQVMESAVFNDMKLPKKVMIQILSTDSELSLKDRIKKRTDKNNLYEAINIASIWLERILETAQ